MKACQSCGMPITLKPLTEEDVSIFFEWLDKEYIYKWMCPKGEEHRRDWMNEINNRDGKYSFIKHFIVYFNDVKIGFCQYLDCFYAQEYYGTTIEKCYAYGIGYLIGEEEYLNKGIGKTIIKMLEEKIVEIGGKEIVADPSPENILSIKTLLSNGFVKIKDDDYRKKNF